MSAKNTPGPWQIDSVPGQVHIVAADSAIARVMAMRADGCGEANARLIAAAPELLEALILLEAEMVLSGNAGSVDYGWKPAIEKTRAAIAKATGEPS